MTIIVPGKVFETITQHCWVNYAPHAMPRTTFVHVSKTFPATIVTNWMLLSVEKP